jgi:hypothetical protein
MATTHDIADLKAQFDERIGHLRESFGVVETDVTRLGHFTQDFTFSSLEEHQRDNNDINQVAINLHTKSDGFVAAVGSEETALKTQFDALQHMLSDGQTQLDSHIQQHESAHGVLADASHGFVGNIEQVIGEVTHAQGDYVNHVQEMHSTLTSLAEKVFGAATSVDHSVKQTQTEALNAASTELHALMDTHLTSHVPTNFQETVSQLTQHVHDLGEHATTAGNNMQNEIATLLHDIADFAAHEVHDKIEQKFQHLMEEALAFLMQEILETIVVTTTGVATTAAMSEVIPILAVLKHALDGIKEAIKIFKTLEEIF